MSKHGAAIGIQFSSLLGSNAMNWVAIYIASILAVNYGFTVIPPLELPTGDLWPPMSLIVGLIFVFRDFAQRAIGHYVILAMLVGGALSYLMADPFVALASVTAFLISESVDWAVYTFTRRPFSDRILISSAVGTPVDSVAFLFIIGIFSWPAVVLMTLSKMLGAVVVWRMVRA